MSVDIHEFDQDLFDKVRVIMKEVFSEFIQAYLRDGERYIHQIKDGCKRHEMDKIVQYAHPLKSASASIGATSLSRIAEELEKNARKSLAKEQEIDVDWVELHQEMEQAFAYIKEKLEKELS